MAIPGNISISIATLLYAGHVCNCYIIGQLTITVSWTPPPTDSAATPIQSSFLVENIYVELL